MTKTHKDFQITAVVPSIYCSSSRHYFVPVTFINNKTERRGNLCLTGYIDYETTHYYWKNGGKSQHRQHVAPTEKSLDFVRKELAKALEAGELKVYEHYQDGERRYTDYRYHSMNMLKSLIDVSGEPCTCDPGGRVLDNETLGYGWKRQWFYCTGCGEHWLEKTFVG